jgi:coenzyme F420-reducing hydrogenase gamma subunit
MSIRIITMPKKKLKIGWFSFTCSEDSTMIWLELMNDNYFKWKNLMDIRYARVLRKNNKIKDLDVAFVEGAIATEKDAEKLKEIRNNAKKLIAIGSCAINGMPAAQRNNFDDKTKQEIAFLIKRFNQTEKVRTVKDIVKVDDEVPGCPMDEHAFLAILEKYLKEFGINA